MEVLSNSVRAVVLHGLGAVGFAYVSAAVLVDNQYVTDTTANLTPSPPENNARSLRTRFFPFTGLLVTRYFFLKWRVCSDLRVLWFPSLLPDISNRARDPLHLHRKYRKLSLRGKFAVQVRFIELTLIILFFYKQIVFRKLCCII